MPLNAAGKPCGRGSAGVEVAGRKFALYRAEAPVELAPLSRQVVGDLVMMAKHSRKTDSADEFLDLFVELLMMEWNAQLAQMYQRAGTSHRPPRARAAAASTP